MDIIEKIDKLFAPDIRVKINEDSYITACEALTPAGAKFLLKNAILDHNYDSIIFEDVCIESICPESWN
jgi:hypothetical protein